MSSSKQLKLGALMSYVAIVINIVTGLLYTPWMINSIGRENFGLYTLAMSVISLFVFDFGLSSAVTRFIAKYLAEERQDKANNCLGLVYRLYLIIDVVLFLILVGVFFFIPQIYKELSPDEIQKFEVVYCVAALYSVISFPFIPVNGVLTAHEKFIQLKICDVAHKLIIVIAMSVCLLLGGGLYSLVIVNAAAGVLTILFKLFCIRRYTPQSVSLHYSNKSEFREILGFSGWVTVIAVAQRCVFNLAPSILGALSGSTAIAILGIAITLEGYTYTFSSAINGMFLPKVSRIVADVKGDVLPLMIRVGRIMIYVISLIVFGVVILGRDFIQLWVGPDFNESYFCAVLIILPSLLQLPQDIGNQTIYAKNKVRKLSTVYVVMAVTNIAGAIILAPSLGALGICISICIAYIFRTIGMDVIFYRDLNIDVFAFFRETFVKMAIPLALTLIIGFGCDYMIPLHSWVGLVVKGGLFVLGYCVVMFTMSMNSSEKELLVSIFRKPVR